jgi:hypothetical protein
MTRFLRALVLLAAVPQMAQAIDLPSGQPVELQEVLAEELGGELWLRFRYVAPRIARTGEALEFAAIAPDFAYICENVALPYMAEHALAGQVVVISMADRPVEFGVADPGVTQYFEAFRPENDTCIWEGF